MKTLDRMTLDSPLGPIDVVTHGARVCAVDFADRWPVVERRLRQRFGPVAFRIARDGAALRAPLGGMRRRFEQYFRGRVDALDGIPMDLGGTPFQVAVWRALSRIPAGATTTYAELARAAGHPRAARAAGHAAGLNPVALAIPCHRALGSDGALRGYAGGLERKGWLLSHEAQSVQPRSGTRRAR